MHCETGYSLTPAGDGWAMKSPIVKRSIVIAGHKTSVSLENAFWEGLKEIAAGRKETLSVLVGGIDSNRRHGNLSSALRLFVLNHYQLNREMAARDVAPQNEPSTEHSPRGRNMRKHRGLFPKPRSARARA
jgi:predicted DNA-binding ribbon-helix-helix protein